MLGAPLACTTLRGPIFGVRSPSSARRESEAEGNRQSDRDAQDPSPPGFHVDWPQWRLGMGVIVVPMVFAVVVGEMVDDRAFVAGRVGSVLPCAHRRHSGRRSARMPGPITSL